MLYPSAGWSRKVEEKQAEGYRSEVRRDAARVLHCPSFRRLQGKTQLFPSFESDFFRNRLTHSLEVGQVAKSIAIRLNAECSELKGDPIDPDLVELAGWIHDLGHPPFGHQGEDVLDELMHDSGGFEGNAQTLRILTRIEKKRLLFGNEPLEGQKENRAGLNLTARTLASAIKYDRAIPITRTGRTKADKGFYKSEADIVEWVRTSIGMSAPMKTIECSIMDLADDIAYSTYDLEDALKAGFVNVMDILSTNKETLEQVATKVSESTGADFAAGDVMSVFERVFGESTFAEAKRKNDFLEGVRYAHAVSKRLCDDGYIRTSFTSQLLSLMIRDIRLEHDKAQPANSRATLSSEMLTLVETLKNFTYVKVIGSPRVQVQQFRAKDVLKTIFESLVDKAGRSLLPDDYRDLYDKTDGPDRKRVVCDFIAGMTDRYAVEFFGRLRSESPQTIFKPI